MDEVLARQQGIDRMGDDLSSNPTYPGTAAAHLEATQPTGPDLIVYRASEQGRLCPEAPSSRAEGGKSGSHRYFHILHPVRGHSRPKDSRMVPSRPK